MDMPDRITLEDALGRAPELAEVAPGVGLGRDLVLQDGPNGLDLGFVTGSAALHQSLTLAMTTLEGADVFNTAFGFDGLNALIEETDPILQRERVRIAAVRVLEKDPRVRRVLDIKLGGDRLDRVTTPGRALDVAVQFEVPTGTRLSLAFGGPDFRE